MCCHGERGSKTVETVIGVRTPEGAALRKVVRPLVPKRLHPSLKEHVKSRDRSSRPQAEPEREKPMRVMSPLEVQFYVLKTRVRIDKAKRMLGYRPAFDLKAGMALTEQWARWANLL